MPETSKPPHSPPVPCVIVGSGYTGGRVLDALGPTLARGFRRSTAAPRAGIARLDLDGAAARLPTLPAGFALLYTVPPRRGAGTDVRLARLLQMLAPLPSRIVYLSTSGVYGDCGGRLVGEAFPRQPRTARAKLRLDAEQQLGQWTVTRGVDLVVLRVPGIYGPGRLGRERIAEGTPLLREEDAPPGNRIHVDDLVSCCIAGLSSVPPGIYNVSDGDHRTATWFTRTVARLAGLPDPPLVSRAEAEATFAAARLSFLGESRRLDNRKMREQLGVEPKYADAEDGIRASLADEDTARQAPDG